MPGRVLDFRDVRPGDPIHPSMRGATREACTARARYLCPSLTAEEAERFTALAFERHLPLILAAARALCLELTGATESRTLPREHAPTREDLDVAHAARLPGECLEKTVARLARVVAAAERWHDADPGTDAGELEGALVLAVEAALPKYRV